MSIFGTLGRKGRRKASVSHELSLDNGDNGIINPSGSLHKSTPNLNKVGLSNDQSPNRLSPSPGKGTVSPTSALSGRSFKGSLSPFRIFHGSGTNTPVTSLSSVSAASQEDSSRLAESPQATTQTTPITKTSTLRGLVSMISSASAIKKSKSGRHKVYAASATQHLQSTTGDEARTTFDYNEEIQGNTQDIIVPSCYNSEETTRPLITLRSLSMKSSQSVPNMETDGDSNVGRHSVRYPSVDSFSGSSSGIGKFNSEPGVASSSSNSISSACTNPSESESCRSGPAINRSIDIDNDTFSVGSQADDIYLERRRLMLQAAKKFNSDPKKGIDFLILNGLLERTPESIAQFLKNGEQLSKTAIGNYLGEHHEFNLEVLHAFVDLHDFTNVLLVEALRQFLWSFRLPGEAQKIDRMMECFAKRYTQLNTNLFANSDTCYLLSFAIIMLNTSLHNPNVKEKPSLEQFIQMNRDIDDGQPLDRKFVTSLYNSILTEPFQIPPEDGNDLMLTFFNPAIEGWLWKQSGRYKTWKRRWFILSNNCLYYFLFTTDKDPRGIIPLENVRVRRSIELGKEYCFTLYKESSDPRISDYIKSCKASDGKLTAGKHVRYHLATKTRDDRDRWITAISQNSSFHNFYTMLAQMKSQFEARQRGGGGSRNTTSNRQSQTSISATVIASPGTVRKSQIGLPLTSLDSKSLSHLPTHSQKGVQPHRNFGKDPHDYFASSSINLRHIDENEQQWSDGETTCRVSVDMDTKSVSYQTFSLPRAKSKKKQQFLLQPPLRKFSLPPETNPSRLTSRVDYLTTPGIRISVEDTSLIDISLPPPVEPPITDNVQIMSDELTCRIDESNCSDPSRLPDLEHVAEEKNSKSEISENGDAQVAPEILLVSTDSSKPVRPETLIDALKGFAAVMENLSLSPEVEEVEEDAWTNEMEESLSLGNSGLTRQCLRSSFKSKKQRYRQNPSAHRKSRRYQSGTNGNHNGAAGSKRKSQLPTTSMTNECDQESDQAQPDPSVPDDANVPVIETSLLPSSATISFPIVTERHSEV